MRHASGVYEDHRSVSPQTVKKGRMLRGICFNATTRRGEICAIRKGEDQSEWIGYILFVFLEKNQPRPLFNDAVDGVSDCSPPHKKKRRPCPARSPSRVRRQAVIGVQERARGCHRKRGRKARPPKWSRRCGEWFALSMSSWGCKDLALIVPGEGNRNFGIAQGHLHIDPIKLRKFTI